MTYDPDTFEKAIAEITDEIYRMRKISGITSRPKEFGYLEMSFSGDAKNWFMLNGTANNETPSKHEELALAAAESRICSLGTDAVRAILSSASALDAQPSASAFLRFGPRTQSGPTVSLRLCEMSLGARGRFYDASEMSEIIATMLRRVENITPGERQFLFNDCHELQAASPEDALRLFAAISRPDLFTEEYQSPHRLPPMVEQFDTSSYMHALQEG